MTEQPKKYSDAIYFDAKKDASGGTFFAAKPGKGFDGIELRITSDGQLIDNVNGKAAKLKARVTKAGEPDNYYAKALNDKMMVFRRKTSKKDGQPYLTATILPPREGDGAGAAARPAAYGARS
jgi:hypothetical protein